jgi:ABC-type nickel/cobalt efflux system permease component RcnA
MEWSTGDLYSWLVFLHLAGLLGFVMSHGVSVGVLFALRRTGTLERTRSLLDLSASSFPAVYASVLLILAAGIAAGIVGGKFTFGPWWLWISIALFIGIAFYMSYVRWVEMVKVRHAAGLQTPDDVKKGIPAPEPGDGAAIVAAVEHVRPWVVLTVGFGGLLVILLLMMFKPI